MSSTKPVGIRLPITMLDKAKKINPNFSEFIRCVLREKLKSFEVEKELSIEEQVDILLEDLNHE